MGSHDHIADELSSAKSISLSLLSLLDWLNSEPRLDDICRGLVLAYLHQYQPSKCRIVEFSSDDSLAVLSDYGYLSSVGHASKTMTANQWRQSTNDFSKLLGCQDKFYWNRNSTAIVVPFRPHGIVSGALSIGFDLPQRKTDEIGIFASQLGMAIGLFVNLTSNRRGVIGEVTTNSPAISPTSDSNYESIIESFAGSSAVQVAKNANMTGRQLQILEGMIEGKTNFEIAAEMGYSVSTVRQETMKIYQTLNVTGRRAAAQEALRQKIV